MTNKDRLAKAVAEIKAFQAPVTEPKKYSVRVRGMSTPQPFFGDTLMLVSAETVMKYART